MSDKDDFVLGLRRYLDGSLTMYHAAALLVDELEQSGCFERLYEDQRWQLQPGKGYYLIRNESSVLAFVVGSAPVGEADMRLTLSHCDSPSFRLKNRSARVEAGCLWMGVEVYGGPLYATWCDRDLGIAGRAFSCQGGQLTSRLLDSGRAVASFPNLAIHLHKKFNQGFEYNPQQHLLLLLGQREEKIADEETFPRELKDMFSLADGETPELFVYDRQPSALLDGGRLLASQRIDDLAMVYAQLWALLRAAADYRGRQTLVSCVVDSEEIGNLTFQGGQSDFIRRTLERIFLEQGGSRQDFMLSCARSKMLSMDGGHATHAAYPDCYDSSYPLILGKGPALKVSSRVSYSTSFASARWLESLAAAKGIPVQWSISRSDQLSGRTVGPPVSADLGIPAVDVGAGQLAMHSVRELAAVSDIEQTAHLTQYFFMND